MPSKKNYKKKASSKEKEQRKQAANRFHAGNRQATGKLCEAQLSQEATKLFRKLGTVPNYSTVDASMDAIRQLAILAGTDVELNDRDPYGDGDQSDVGEKSIAGEPQRQILRNMFAEGGDLGAFLRYQALSPFAMACASGNAKLVLKMIQEKTDPEERIKLLEKHQNHLIRQLLWLIQLTAIGI